jgi:hypothetical protein
MKTTKDILWAALAALDMVFVPWQAWAQTIPYP